MNKISLLLLLGLSLLILGCQTPLADGFREHVVPDDTVWLAATSPLTLPTYVLLTVVDVVVVNPFRGFSNIPDWLATYWTWGGTQESNAVWWSLFPFKLVGTPVVILSAILFSEQFINE